MLTEGQRELCEVVKPYKCPLLDPYQSDRYNEIVRTCVTLIDAASDSEIKKIEANLRLGEMVAEVLKVATYGSRAVEKLAVAISKTRGKTVYPQRLYEAYEVWDTVRTMDKVYEIQKKLGEDITWNWLVKNAVKGFDKENNKDVKNEKIQKTLKHIENAVEKIETLDRVKDNLDDDTVKEFEGVVHNLYQTVSKIVENGKEQAVNNCKTEAYKTVIGENVADNHGISGGTSTDITIYDEPQIEHENRQENIVELLDTICELLSLSIERKDWEGIEDVYRNLLKVAEIIKHRLS